MWILYANYAVLYESYLPHPFCQFLVVCRLVWEPLVLLLDHDKPLLHPAHLLVQGPLLPRCPGGHLRQPVVVDEAVPVLPVVHLELGVLPVINNCSIFTTSVILLNYCLPLFPEIIHGNV